jgi:hypothetical protein
MSMKTKLLCFFILAMFLTLSVAQAAELEGVKIGVGSLRMGGIFQSWLYATNWDNNIHYGGVYKYTEFTAKRARFLFWGTIVPDKVKYFVQLDMLNSPNPFLDYKMIFADYVPKTSVCVGRFLPYWTLYMWKPVSQLELVYYPLVVSELDAFSVYLGLFNGADIPNNKGDNNNAKDFMARLDIHPKMDNMELLFGGEFWMGRYRVDEATSKNNTMFGGFVSLDYNKMLKFRGEYLTRTLQEATLDPETEEAIDLKDAGFYIMGGYTPIEWLEVLARFDSYDPNTDVDKDGESWITLGLNYMFLKYNAVIGLNLIKKTEQYKIMNTMGEEVDLDNDEAILQFQIAF